MVRGRDVSEVAAARVQDALRLGRGAAGVHDVERVLCIEGLGLVRVRLPVDHLVPPDIAPIVPGDVLTGAPDHEHPLDVGTLLQRLVDGGLERNWARPAGSRRLR